MTGYQKQTYYNAIHTGTGELSKLPYYRIGRTIRIAEEDIERFLEGRRVVPGNGTAE
jgi:excisionase family DNA binding protein